jgi:A nuclease family of the HNH/ENDO VII superfamily with conserved AHH
MELLEKAAIALAQAAGDDCPFPHKDGEHNRTNDFKNNSTTLGGKLKGGESRMMNVKVRNTTHSMKLAFQAHHLIPGQSIKVAKKIRKYMTKGQTVKGNVGYKQNDAWNGIWLPALPYGGWSAAGVQGGPDVKFAYAYQAMITTGLPFHIPDSSHKNYNAMVRLALEELRLKMIQLQAECKKCKKRSEKPYDPPYRLVEMIDRVAKRLKGRMQGSTKKWQTPYCTSDYAVLVGQGKKPS